MMFERLIDKLLPTGRAWIQLPLKVQSAIFGGIADEFKKVRATALLVKDSNLPHEMDAQFIPDWEKRFDLPQQDMLTEQERRDRLDTQWQQGGLTVQYLQAQLQGAGFEVYIKESWMLAQTSGLGDIILGDDVLEGNFYTGQAVTHCTTGVRGDTILGDFTLDSSSHIGPPAQADPCKTFAGEGATLGDFILGDDIPLESNKAKFIVNHIDELLDPIDTCPINEERCIFIFFIQGPGEFGDFANIPAARYSEFRELVLKFKRGPHWAACFLNLV